MAGTPARKPAAEAAEFEFTPGPWKFEVLQEDDYPRGIREVPAVVTRRCTVAELQYASGATKAQLKANGLLIAAAPDMLDALLYVASEFAVHPPCTQFFVEKVRAAIQKATVAK